MNTSKSIASIIAEMEANMNKLREENESLRARMSLIVSAIQPQEKNKEETLIQSQEEKKEKIVKGREKTTLHKIVENTEQITIKNNYLGIFQSDLLRFLRANPGVSTEEIVTSNSKYSTRKLRRSSIMSYIYEMKRMGLIANKGYWSSSSWFAVEAE